MPFHVRQVSDNIGTEYDRKNNNGRAKEELRPPPASETPLPELIELAHSPKAPARRHGRITDGGASVKPVEPPGISETIRNSQHPRRFDRSSVLSG